MNLDCAKFIPLDYACGMEKVRSTGCQVADYRLPGCRLQVTRLQITGYPLDSTGWSLCIRLTLCARLNLTRVLVLTICSVLIKRYLPTGSFIDLTLLMLCLSWIVIFYQDFI